MASRIVPPFKPHGFGRVRQFNALIFSVADMGCSPRKLNTDFYPSRIPDTKTSTKERGEKKIVAISFFVATNFTKLKIILLLKCSRQKFGPVFKEL
jgi:hypothetical protein